MFETTFRNLDDTLRKDAGCSSELDYIEQTSWVLFLKYLDDLEADREHRSVASMVEVLVMDYAQKKGTQPSPNVASVTKKNK
jgi:hypothetical protein